MRLFPHLMTGVLVSAALAGYGQGLPAAPTKQAHPPKQIKVLPVPVLFYQQETGFGYGLGALASGRLGQDTLTRSSNARVQYWRTTEKQSLGQFVHTIYGPGEKYYLNGEISAYVNRLYYFGVGNESSDNSKRSFLDFDLFIINQRVQLSVGRYQFLGAQYRLSRVYNQVPEQGRVSDTGEAINLTTQNYFNLDPRVDARQRQNYSLSGVGPVYTYDSRDVALAASKGSLFDLQVMFNGGFVGSDYNFVRYQLDARHFQRILSDKTILALQVVGQFHSGDVPWYGLAGIGANLGGTLYNNANLMRGVYEQRYRDRQLITAQAELRQHLFWRIDGAAFLGVGQVGYDLKDYSFGGIHTAGGIGARFNFIRRDRVNLRFDYAFGKDPGLYFAIGEAF